MTYVLNGAVSAVVQTAAGSAVSGLAWDHTPVAGELLICWWNGQGATTAPSSPSGFNSGQEKTSGSTQIGTPFYKQAAGSDAVPAFAGITSVVQTVMLGQFSGNVTPQTSVKDQQFSGQSTITSTPVTATATAQDATLGELVVYACGNLFSSPSTDACAVTVNGLSGNDITNNGTSTVNHYDFGWAITVSNGADDVVSLSRTTTNATSCVVSCLSFKVLVPPGVTFSVSDPQATRIPGIH